MKVRIRNF